MSEAARISVCRGCDAPGLETFLSLGELPPSDGFLDAERLIEPEARYPLEVAFCPHCTLVQILCTVPPETLFGKGYLYLSSYAESVLENARLNVAARLAERRLGPGSLVVELASNDGYLLQNYLEAGIRVLGIDPAPEPVAAARHRGVPTRQAFFGESLASELVATGQQADIVHANNVLAHVADTNGFVSGIATLLKDDGVAVIEVPYVREMVEQVAFDTIYHEHLCYFSVTALDALFRRHELCLTRVEAVPIHGGSLRLFVEKLSRPNHAVAHYLSVEQAAGLDGIAYFRNFARRVQELRILLRVTIEGLKASGARIAAYGAAAKGTILLNAAGIGTDLLDYVVDRNPMKHGLYMPGVHVPIRPVERLLQKAPPDYLLLLAWNHKEEIMKQQTDYRKAGGRFIVPIPEPEIL